MLFAHLENLLHARQLLSQAWVVDLIAVQLLHLCFRDEAALIAEALLGQILAAIVPDLFLGDPFLLLQPVSDNLSIDYLS